MAKLVERSGAATDAAQAGPLPKSETRSPSLPLINTQLQLGEPRLRLRSNRFNGFP